MKVKKRRNRRGPANRTIFLVGVFLLLLFSYFNINYLKEKFRSFSLNNETSWSIDRTSVELASALYSQKEQVKILSPVFHLDKIYHSMMGPANVFFFTPDNRLKNEIVWLTDYSVKVRDRSGKLGLSDEFLCHNNLDVAFSEILPQRERSFNNRLVMVAQGLPELHFPEGFALPLLSHDNISITTEALNHNLHNGARDVRHEINMAFVRSENLRGELKPLFKRAINLLVEADTCNEKNACCCPPGHFCRPAASPVIKSVPSGSVNYTGRWVIPQGADTVKYDVTQMIALPYVTRMHYASVHVYPFCVSLELRDATADSTVFKATVNNFTNRMGIESMTHYSDSRGTEMHPSHKYELVCITNNTSGAPQNMMAGMILYFYDKDMEKNMEEKNSSKMSASKQ